MLEYGAFNLLERASETAFTVTDQYEIRLWNKAATVTGPSFCTTVSERVYITDRTGFFVPTLRRVFGCLLPKEIAASRDLLGEFVRRLLSKSSVRTALIIFLPPSLDALFRFC